MAITYHSGRRLQGLSTDENTVYDSSGKLTGTHTSDNTTVDGWLAANKDHIKVNGGNIKWDLARDGTNYAISYDLGANISNEKWLLRFRATWDTIAACAGNEQYIGVSDLNSTNSTTANHDFLGCMISMWASNADFRNTFANGSTLNGGGGASNWSADPSRSVDTFYFVEIKRISTTTFSISFSSTDSYDGNLASSGSQTCSADTKNLRYIYFGAENAGSTECGQDCLIDNIQFYDGYTTPTTVGKPTNVQVGSRFEETDTRKMYHYELTTPTFADDFNTDDWTDNTSSVVGVSTGNSRFQFVAEAPDAANDSSVYDLGTGNVSDTTWILRWEITYTNHVAGNGANHAFGITASNQGSTSTTSDDGIMFCWGEPQTVGQTLMGVLGFNGAAPSATGTFPNSSSRVTTNLTDDTKYYCTLSRDSATSATFTIKTGSHDGTALSGYPLSNTSEIVSGLSGLRYIKFLNRSGNGNRSGASTGYIENLQFYNGVTSAGNAWKEEGT